MAVSASNVTLYHGTTLNSTKAIEQKGFVGADIRAEFERVCIEHGVDAERLWNKQGVSFLRDARARQHHVHFAGTFKLAARYARRAPEVRLMTLELIFNDTRDAGDFEDAKAMRIAGEEWAKGKIARSQIPAVLTLDVPLNELAEADAAQIAGQLEGDAHITSLADWEAGTTLADVPISIEAVDNGWIQSVAVVDPCTCWRDGRHCRVCRESSPPKGGN